MDGKPLTKEDARLGVIPEQKTDWDRTEAELHSRTARKSAL